MKQIELPLPGEPRPVDPHPGPRDPALWVARLLILREPRLEEGAVIRDLRLRRGLNILWAPPLAITGESRLFDGRLTGHTAGKTTFCRLLRYLLGEERFGTARGQERIRARVPEGWVVGEVFLRGKPWIIGRPFALGVHPFAAPVASVEEALSARGPYQEFQSALEAAIVAPIGVKTQTLTKKPFDWPLLLTWLTRDQEARFAHLVGFRDPSSESGSPSPPMGERYAIVRAVLELMSDEESELAQRNEALGEQRKQLEASLPILRARAAEDRRRLAQLLGLGASEGYAGPLFAARLSAVVAERHAALDRVEAARRAKEVAAEEARRAWAEAAEERGACRARLAEIEIAKAAQGALRSPAPGYCNVPLSLAEAQGCPLAVEARRLRRPADSEGERPREVTPAFEQAEAAARQAMEEASAAQEELHRRYVGLEAALQEEKERSARERAAKEELDRLKGHAADAEEALLMNEAQLTETAKAAQQLSERRSARKREQKEALGRLSERFGYVVQALLGRRLGGEVEVSGGQIALHVAEHGEREGAAMETIKILAFDLAALTLGIEGQGSFPGFLLHDGPREADMDQGIYERLFLYAVEELEEAFGGVAGVGEPAFQYIVTTTAPPPRRLARAPWVLKPKLDASVPEGRLFGMDL
jgi:hypothetical protein